MSAHDTCLLTRSSGLEPTLQWLAAGLKQNAIKNYISHAAYVFWMDKLFKHILLVTLEMQKEFLKFFCLTSALFSKRMLRYRLMRLPQL